jgi:hypothetical protein
LGYWAGCFVAGGGYGVRQGSCSFLKKRTKKLLHIKALGAGSLDKSATVFAAFFKKKRGLFMKPAS